MPEPEDRDDEREEAMRTMNRYACEVERALLESEYVNPGGDHNYAKMALNLAETIARERLEREEESYPRWDLILAWNDGE